MKDRLLVLSAYVKKQWLSLWIIITVVVLFSLSVFASYELLDERSKMHRVISAVSDSGMMFSSNYLVENGLTTYAVKYYADSEGLSAYDIDVYLWNYNIKNPSKKYPSALIII